MTFTAFRETWIQSNFLIATLSYWPEPATPNNINAAMLKFIVELIESSEVESYARAKFFSGYQLDFATKSIIRVTSSVTNWGSPIMPTSMNPRIIIEMA